MNLSGEIADEIGRPAHAAAATAERHAQAERYVQEQELMANNGKVDETQGFYTGQRLKAGADDVEKSPNCNLNFPTTDRGCYCTLDFSFNRTI